MSVDKLVDSTQLDADLTSVANAIRTKGGTSAALAFPAGFVSAIGDIPSGGGTDYLAELCNGTLTTYESDDVVKIVTGIFRGYTALTSIKIKNCENLGSYALGGTRIANIVLPKFTGQLNQGQCFNGCSMLTAADLGASTTSGVRIPGGFFAAASALKTIVLRYSSLISLGATNAFNLTPFASNGTGGTLYVPSSLISSYQSATNWSTILGYANNQILPIEGSIYETQYADGTPIT
jgi:hypothetical protein